MAKQITFLPSASPNNIDTNFQRVNTALQDVVARSGELPNNMQSDLDMNSNDILNVNTVDAKRVTIDGLPLVPGGTTVVTEGLYTLIDSMSNTPVPNSLSRIYVSSQSSIEDGLGGMFIDQDNGTPIVFSTPAGEGATARNWYRVEDVSEERLTAGVRAKLVIENISYFGGSPSLPDNAAAFIAADVATAANHYPIYVGPGVYETSYTPTGLYFGPGIISIGEDHSYAYLDLNVPQSVNTRIPSTSDEDDDGSPEPRLNLVIGQGTPSLGYSADANVILGYKAGRGQLAQGRLTAVGYLAGGTADGYADTIIGASAASQSAFRERNVVIGATGGKWLGTDDPAGTDHDIWIAPDETYFGLATRNPTFWNLLTEGGTPRGVPLASGLPTQNPDAARNVIIGRDALNHAPKAFGNVALGYRAGRFFYNADENVAIGMEAMGDGLLAYRNVAIGTRAMNYSQTGQYSVAIGHAAMQNDAFAIGNVAIGPFAMLDMGKTFTTQASSRAEIEGNTAVGRNAMRYATEGMYGTAIGMDALGGGVNTGNRNTAVGFSALAANTSGGNNVAVGQRAGLNNTSGSNLVILGGQAGETLQDSSPMTGLSNVIAIGYQASVSGANQAQIGNSSVTTYAYGAVQDRSDERDKADIRDSELGLDFIMALRPVDYRLDYRDDYVDRSGDGDVIAIPKDGSKKRTRFHHGFIAQDIKRLIDAGVIEDFGGFQHHAVNGGLDVMSLGYTEMIAPIVKAIQELANNIETLKGNAA